MTIMTDAAVSMNCVEMLLHCNDSCRPSTLIFKNEGFFKGFGF